MFLTHGMYSMIQQVVYLLPVDKSYVKLETRPSARACLFYAPTGLIHKPKTICMPSWESCVSKSTTLDGWPNYA